jgi:CheY-like chemotaxis protein
MSLTSESSFRPQQIFSEGQIRAKILVAEDPFIATFLRTILQRHGHEVVTSEVNQASEFLRTGSLTADLLITNNPTAFLPFAGTIRILYIAASPDPILASQFNMCRTLRKPFRNEELLKTVAALASLEVP